MKKNIFAILIISFLIVVLSLASKEIVSAVNLDSNKVSLGTDFSFDNVLMNIGSDYSYSTIVNEDTIYNGRIVISLPITITNNLDIDYNFNYNSYYLYGPNGTELNSVSKYFKNTSIDYSNSIKSNNSVIKYIYMLYEGNGEYKIRFKNQVESVDVCFNVNR